MVTFLLVNPKNETSSIAILVSFRGKKYRRAVGESLPVKLWNNTKKRAKVTADFTYGNIINDVLSKWESAALRTMSYFKEYYNPPQPDVFFSQLDKEYYKDEVTGESPFFTDYIQTFINRYSKVRQKTTIKSYVTTLNKLKEYEQVKRRRLRFEDITIDFYNDLQNWIYSQNYADNYFGAMIKFIKLTYREARLVDNLHNLENIAHKDFVKVTKDTDSIYLTEDELLRIHKLDLSVSFLNEYYPNLSQGHLEQKIECLKIVRDRFLIGAYTGLRVSDFGRLNEINISDYIRIKALKTGSETVIPIHPIIREILINGFDANITISDQKINKHIKEIAMLAQINEQIMTTKHIGGKVEQAITPKYNLVCTHTARRSFATNAYKAGVPTLAIMKITGHKKESTFLKYIKVSAEENAELLSSHPFFSTSLQ